MQVRAATRLEALWLVATGSVLLLVGQRASSIYSKLDCFNLSLCGRLPPDELDSQPPAASRSRAHSVGGEQRATASPTGASPDVCQTCARRDEFPWYARLELHFKPEPGGRAVLRYCGATVIDRLYLLTSASCVKRAQLGLAQRGLAVLGLQNLLESADRWQVRSIAALCGRNFDPERVNSNFSDLRRPAEDVTVVKLNATLHFDQRVAPVCLHDPEALLGWSLEQGTMVGFGIYDELEQLPPARLSRHLVRPCNSAELATVAHRRRPDQICAIDAQLAGNPCEGDQGNGVYGRLPLVPRMGLHSILGLPAKRCTPGRAEPVLLSDLGSLKAQVKEMLSGC